MINEKNIIAYLEPVVFVYFKINAQYYNTYIDSRKKADFKNHFILHLIVIIVSNLTPNALHKPYILIIFVYAFTTIVRRKHQLIIVIQCSYYDPFMI